MSEPNGNGETVHQTRVSQLVLTLDHDSMGVTIGGAPVSIALAQMIVDEAGRILESQRRAAMAIQLRDQLAEDARLNALVKDALGRH